MENIIKKEKGVFTIIERCGKDFKIEMFDPYESNPLFYVEYSSDFYRLEDKLKIERQFLEFEPQIIQIMKLNVNDNLEFYKHFDIDFQLFSGSANLVHKEIINNEFFHIKWDWYLVSSLKTDSLEYLKGLKEEKKNFENSF